MPRKPIALVLPAVALLAAVCAAPALAVDPTLPTAPTPAAASLQASATPDCGLALELLPEVDQSAGATCPAVEPASEEPAFLAPPPSLRRTCRCSCGQPCQTNADCGGALCHPGITCC